MMSFRSPCLYLLCLSLLPETQAQTPRGNDFLRLNGDGYFERQGANVMVFDDFYPEGHQGGVTIIQCGTRIAANGDVRLEPTPGQWSPVPRLMERHVDREHEMITVDLCYPDSSKDRKGFNPLIYPDLRLQYSIRTIAEGNSIRLIVDLLQPLPIDWADRVGFNLELFPGLYFGEHYLMDSRTGIFPRQANGPMTADRDHRIQITPLAVGRVCTIAPGIADKQMTIASNSADLQLLDGRALSNNGWFVLRSTISARRTARAVEWVITPQSTTNWVSPPIIHVSEIGYHPDQEKYAVVELDKRTESCQAISLINVGTDSVSTVLSDPSPGLWGKFLRYNYARFDFSSITREGLYQIRCGEARSNQFEIKRDLYGRHVWQPTLEYFLPVQMCHMRIKDRYKVWHGLCHMDDALMAPVNHIHFDGYFQGSSTLTGFGPGAHVTGLNIGGWHDAGDYDLRVESQAGTVYKLALAYELLGDDYDATSVDQETRTVELHTPNGTPDIVEQIEHGLLSILGAYSSMGRLYRGIICPTLEQYVHLGDASTMSDNLVYAPDLTDPILQKPLHNDDRWVFTEENPARELSVARALAAANRVMKKYKPALAESSLRASEELYHTAKAGKTIERNLAAAELFLTTGKETYKSLLLEQRDTIAAHVERFSEVIGRVAERLRDREFTKCMETAVAAYAAGVQGRMHENPFGVPYKPYIWGAGWNIQSFGVAQLFLHLSYPKLVPLNNALRALNFVLGCHPGENTASFASGVGVNSLTVAYGSNRDEWSYIPGGVASGTALIRPDLPELKVWPYFWQQTEYVMGGGATDFMLLAMAADHLLNK